MGTPPPSKITAHTCDCGKPALRRWAGAWVCPRCRELETRYYGIDSMGRRLNARIGGIKR